MFYEMAIFLCKAADLLNKKAGCKQPASFFGL